jgi:hypothetical protein
MVVQHTMKMRYARNDMRSTIAPDMMAYENYYFLFFSLLSLPLLSPTGVIIANTIW